MAIWVHVGIQYLRAGSEPVTGRSQVWHFTTWPSCEGWHCQNFWTWFTNKTNKGTATRQWKNLDNMFNCFDTIPACNILQRHHLWYVQHCVVKRLTSWSKSNYSCNETYKLQTHHQLQRRNDCHQRNTHSLLNHYNTRQNYIKLHTPLIHKQLTGLSDNIRDSHISNSHTYIVSMLRLHWLHCWFFDFIHSTLS